MVNGRNGRNPTLLAEALASLATLKLDVIVRRKKKRTTQLTQLNHPMFPLLALKEPVATNAEGDEGEKIVYDEERGETKLVITFNDIVEDADSTAFAASYGKYIKDDDPLHVWLEEVYGQVRLVQAKAANPPSGSFNSFYSKSTLLAADSWFAGVTGTNHAISVGDNWGVRITTKPVFKQENDSVKSEMAEEIFYTVFAAFFNIGPPIYGCRIIQARDEIGCVIPKLDENENYIYKRNAVGAVLLDANGEEEYEKQQVRGRPYSSIFLTKTGIPGDDMQRNLVNDESEMVDKSKELLSLFINASRKKMILGDTKAGNLVWIDDKPKFIDFDSRWTFIVRTFSDKCVLYLNLLLYLSNDVCTFEFKKTTPEHAILNSALVERLTKLINKGVPDVLCDTVRNMKFNEIKGYDGFDDKMQVHRVAEVIYFRAEHYCRQAAKKDLMKVEKQVLKAIFYDADYQLGDQMRDWVTELDAQLQLIMPRRDRKRKLK